MKILISGKDSYIGNHIADWLRLSKDETFVVDFLDVREPNWIDKNFLGYDTVIHVAGIVHRKDITDAAIYEKVNTTLPVEVATRAKQSGVRQFVFMSSMAVYGIGKKLSNNIIDQSTPINPKSLYGKSKYKAENLLKELEDDSFLITIVRPPNVYGKGCKGGYITGYSNIVSKIPVIPDAYGDIKQSVIYIDNLCEIIRLLIINRSRGIFTPQDDKAVSAVELMTEICKVNCLHKKKSKVAGVIVRLLSFLSLAVKVYGGVAYSEKVSAYPNGNYVKVPFNEAIKRTLQ